MGRKRITTKEFIERAKIKHPNKYIYDETIYRGAHSTIIITCNLHGNFERAANKHLNGVGCSKCLKNEKIKRNKPKGESLAELHPNLAKQWHPTKNGELTPYMFSEYSNKSIWWKCEKGSDHEWEAIIPNRVKGSGCGVCRGNVIVSSNCLATVNPLLAKEWHPTKNGELTPFYVGARTHRKVWWKCDKASDHEWSNSIVKRNNGQCCPFCAGQKTTNSNCLATINPELAKEWHPTKNGDLTPYDVTTGSSKKVWWKCDKEDDHEWKISTTNRFNGSSCPFCTGHQVTNTNCLATVNPLLAKEWHPTKNGDLTPYDVTSGSGIDVWWKCDKGDDHEWKVNVGSRGGCPICRGLKVVESNSLLLVNPKIAKQWHPTKNDGLTPSDITENSGKKVWWKCNKGDDHEWFVSPNSRLNTGCPFCVLTPQSRQELTITFEVTQFFKDINPKGFKTRVKGKLWSVDIYIPQLDLGIEFDGHYWHKGKRALDKLKTEQLEEEGFEIFRVREEPLKRIFDDDIMSKKPFNAKQVTNDILTQIMSRYTLDAKKIAKIESYIAKKELQNEKGLDKYIEMILTEKAEKKL